MEKQRPGDRCEQKQQSSVDGGRAEKQKMAAPNAERRWQRGRPRRNPEEPAPHKCQQCPTFETTWMP